MILVSYIYVTDIYVNSIFNYLFFKLLSKNLTLLVYVILCLLLFYREKYHIFSNFTKINLNFYPNNFNNNFFFSITDSSESTAGIAKAEHTWFGPYWDGKQRGGTRWGRPTGDDDRNGGKGGGIGQIRCISILNNL